MVHSYPEPGVFRAEKYGLLECQSQVEVGGQCMHLGSPGLYLNVALLGEYFRSLGIGQSWEKQFVSKAPDVTASRIQKNKKI